MLNIENILESQLLTESQAYLLIEDVYIKSPNDIARYTKACDVIMSHLLKTAGTIVSKLRTTPLSKKELALVFKILQNVSDARSHIIAANRSYDMIRAEDSMEAATALLKKHNFE